MKKFFLSSFMAIIFVSGVFSQVTIIPQSQTTGTVNLDGILKMTLINASSTDFTGMLTIEVNDGSNNPVISATSPYFTINKGATRPSFSRNEWNWDIALSPVASAFRATGKLPYNKYTICYTLSTASAIIGAHCDEVESMPSSPPELISPFDKEEIKTLSPLLTWKPPVPTGDAPINYTLTLVEVKDKQTPEEAIETNTPCLQIVIPDRTILQYPGYALPLEYNHTYAWNIQVHILEYPVGVTETWSFKPVPSQEKVSASEVETYFTLLPSLNNGHHPIKEQVLHVEWNNHFGSSALVQKTATVPEENSTYRIYQAGQSNNTINLSSPPTIQLLPGKNKIDLELFDSIFINEEKYIVEIEDVTGRVYYLDFIYRNY